MEGVVKQMKLGELKKSLNRFSGDMDDCDVIFNVMVNGEPDFDYMAFVAYANIPPDEMCIVLGSHGVAIHKMKTGTLCYRDGSKPNDVGFDLSDSK